MSWTWSPASSNILKAQENILDAKYAFFAVRRQISGDMLVLEKNYKEVGLKPVDGQGEEEGEKDQLYNPFSPAGS